MKPLPQISDYPIPETREIEAKILATIISDPSYIYNVARVIKPDMFSTKENKKIWSVVNDMYNANENIDITTVMPRVDRANFINEILSTSPEYSMVGLQGLLGAFIDTYIKKVAYMTSVDTLQGINSGVPCTDIQARFENFTKLVTEGVKDDSTKNAVEIANTLAEKIDKGESNRVPTSIRSLDYYTYGGLNGGNLVILAARPSVGKTTIALQMAVNASMIGKKTLVFSYEMTSEELVQRMILSTGYITPSEYYTKNFQWSYYEKAVSEVCNENLTINDKTMGIDELCQRIRLACQGEGCKFVVIDYLGLIPITDNRANLATTLGEYTRKLKLTAKDCGVPILLLCQLNRQNENEGKKPELNNLRDSGAIEQDADIVLMLSRATDNEGHIIENTIELWIRKNRGGKCNFDNPILLRGNETYSNFKEYD